MVKGIFQIKVRLTILVILCSMFACNFPPNEQDLRDEAKFSFENVAFDRGLDSLPFQGPVDQDAIKSFKVSDGNKGFGWFYIHKNDTVWIYVEVDTLLVKPSKTYFSDNLTNYIDELDRRMQ